MTKTKDEQSEKLTVKMISPYQTYYQGPAVSISAINRTGPFDVLLNHANFFSLLAAGDVMINTGFEQFKFPIEQGIMKVANNQVTVFVDI
jgi:F0F1-type ATP synthase epsilon subunit